MHNYLKFNIVINLEKCKIPFLHFLIAFYVSFAVLTILT